MQHLQQATDCMHLRPNDTVIAEFCAQYALQPRENAGKNCQQSQSCHCLTQRCARLWDLCFMVRLELTAFALAHVHGCIGMPHCVTRKHPDDAYNLWCRRTASKAGCPLRLPFRQ
jgi:hypothetical protein